MPTKEALHIHSRYRIRLRNLRLAVAVGCLFVPHLAHADAAGDRKRAQLSSVRRVAVLPAFFGTDTLGELPPANAHVDREPSTTGVSEKRRAEIAEYHKTLAQLELHARERLPERLTARTHFQLAGIEKVEGDLKALMLTVPQLYQNGGRINGKRFDSLDRDKIKNLAAKLNVDAVLLCSIDEPRKNNGGYYLDVLAGPGYESPKVHDKATFDLILADGTTVIHETIDVVHPVTQIAGKAYLPADWLETEDEVIEDFMDELTRYTPKEKESASPQKP